MRININLKYFDGTNQTINKKIRDKELINIINKNKSHIFKDKTKYSRKDKYKRDYKYED